MDNMDNSVVIAGDIRGLKGNGNKNLKINK